MVKQIRDIIFIALLIIFDIHNFLFGIVKANDLQMRRFTLIKISWVS